MLENNKLNWRGIRTLSIAACLLLVGALAGCSTMSYPPAPKGTPTKNYTYLIGPLDTLDIIVWRNPELSMSVPVRPDGKVSVPLINDLTAAGKTPTELAHDIEQRLSKYIREPVVTVVVSGFTGLFSQEVRVVGAAVKPEALPYRKGMSLLDVMIAVGGLTPFAAGNDATILRDGKQYSVRLGDLIRRGDVSANVLMKPGDVLIIPQSWF